MEIRVLDAVLDNKLLFDIVRYEDDINVFGAASVGRYNISPITKYGRTYAMLEGSSIIGVVEVMSSFERDLAYIYGLSIDVAYRGQGLASKLLKYVISDLEKIGIKRIQLTVDTDNIAAINLYTRHGFRQASVLPNEYGDNVSRFLFERVSKVSHYYTNNSALKSNRQEIDYSIHGVSFTFTTDNGVFSKQKVDFGTDLMLNTFLENEKVGSTSILDYGCGYGVVGIVLKKFFSSSNIRSVDVNDRAMELAKLNYNSNGISDFVVSDISDLLSHSYDYVLLNPPIRTGKANIFEMYENSYKVLNSGGKLYIVIQTKQGAKSTEKKLKELFKDVKTITINGGYRIIRGIK